MYGIWLARTKHSSKTSNIKRPSSSSGYSTPNSSFSRSRPGSARNYTRSTSQGHLRSNTFSPMNCLSSATQPVKSCGKPLLQRRLSLPAEMQKIRKPVSYQRAGTPGKSGTSICESNKSATTRRSVKSKANSRISSLTMSSTPQKAKGINITEYYNKVKEVMDFSCIEDPADRHEAYIFVLDGVNVDKNLHTLDLTGQSDLCEYLGTEGLNEFLSHPGLHNLQYLLLRDCGLTLCPNFQHLKRLQNIDLSGNPLTDIGSSIYSCKCLRMFAVEETNIVGLSLDLEKLEKLLVLKCGSESLKFISNSILEKKKRDTGFKLQIKEEHQGNLVLPSYSTLNDPVLLATYLLNRTPSLSGAKGSQNYYDALMWSYGENGQTCEEIDLSYHKELIEAVGLEGLQKLLNQPNARNAKRLDLSNCGLKSVPDLSGMPQLEEVDLSFNSLKSAEMLESSTLLKLDIQGNDLPTLDANYDKVPSIECITFGSTVTKAISFQLLSKFIAGDIKEFIVPENEMQSALLFPTYHLLTGNIKDLKAFMDSKEISVDHIMDASKRYEALELTVKNRPNGFEHLNLRNKQDLCTTEYIPKLQALLNDKSIIQSITKLTLSGCHLNKETMPNIEKLTKLKILDLDNNVIDDLDMLKNESLEELHVKENPIQGLPNDLPSLPELKTLYIGSKELKYMCYPLMDRIVNKNLKLGVPDDILQNMVFPQGTIRNITEKELNNFVHLDIERIPQSEQQTAFRWYVNHGHKTFLHLNMSSQKDFYKSMVEDNQQDFFKTNGLCSLESLTLNDLKLENVPNLTGLKNLKALNISRNLVRELDKICLPSKVENVNIAENPVETLRFPAHILSSLHSLTAGSATTHFIDFPILEKMDQGLEVEIATRFSDALLLPPKEALIHADVRRRYLEQPESELNRIADEKKLMCLKWLVHDSKKQFESLDLSNQAWIFKPLKKEPEWTFTFDTPNITNLTQLSLAYCSLFEVPDLSKLHSLVSLDLSGNNIKNVHALHGNSLRDLDISGNPITTLDLEVGMLPYIERLTFGSDSPLCLTHSTLHMICKTHVDLNIQEQHQASLLLPSWHILLGGETKIKKYMASSTLDVSFIPTNEHKWKAIEWLMERREKIFTSLSFPGQASFIKYIGMDNLKKLFSHPIMRSIREVYINDCDLNLLPALDNLKNLQIIDASNNKLKSVPHSTTMIQLNISGNQDIKEISIDRKDTPRLNHLVCGSKSMRFITFKAVKTVTIDIPIMYRNALVMPPYKAFNGKLKSYMERPDTFLDRVCPENLVEAVVWLGSESEVLMRVFDLSCLGKRCTKLVEHGLEKIFEGKNFKGLTKLNMNYCHLENVPVVTGLSDLEELMLDSNSISDLEQLESKTLKTLSIQDNLLHTLNVSMEKCPKLKNIVCGSKTLKQISLGLCKEMLYNSDSSKPEALSLSFSEGSTDSLVSPPYDALKDKTLLSKYIEESVFDASWFSSCTDLSELKSVLDDDIRPSIRKLILSKQNHLCAVSGIIGLQSLLAHPKLSGVEQIFLDGCNLSAIPNLSGFTMLHTLDLSGSKFGSSGDHSNFLPSSLSTLILQSCGLDSFPPISIMENLQYLDVSQNHVQEIHSCISGPKLHTLKIRNNPIPDINISRKKFPLLKELVCGSEETEFLGLDLLRHTKSVNGKNINRQTQIQPKSDTNIELTIDFDHTKQLIFPPANVLKNATDSLSKFIEKPENYIKEVDSTGNQISAIQWIQKNVKVDIETLSFSGMENLVKRLLASEDMSLSSILSQPPFTKLKSLDLSSSGLTLWQKLGDNLPNLTCLILDGNKLTSFDRMVLPKGLETLSLIHNPIGSINFPPELVKDGFKVKVGSKDTKHIAIAQLKVILGEKLHIDVDEAYQECLTCPPHDVLKDMSKLAKFIEQPGNLLPELLPDPTDRLFAYSRLVKTDKQTLSQIDISGLLSDPDGKIEEEVRLLLNHDNSTGINRLNLSQCHFSYMPPISRLTSLEHLDISGNHFTGIESNLKLMNLKTLNLVEVPLRHIDVDPVTLQSIQEISCGSAKTQIISRPLLKLHADGQININMSKEFEKHLLLPPVNMLKDAKLLEQFLKDPKEHLDKLPAEDKLLWQMGEENLKSLNLSGQKDLCSNTSGLHELLSRPKLSAIESLYLDDCDLTQLPDLLHLTNLKELYARNNYVTKIDFGLIPKSLQKLYIDGDGNRIESVDIDTEVFQSLTYLQCGSSYTKFISNRLIKEVLDEEDFAINVPDKYGGFLLMPPHSILKENSTDLADYIHQPDIYLQKIPKVEDQLRALDWLLQNFKQDEKEFNKSFSLSGLKGLCKLLGMNGLEERFKLKELKSVKELYIDGCGLEKIPNISLLPHLTVLDVRNNEITSIQTIPGPNRIKSIKLSGNLIPELNFNINSLPDLKSIEFGSSETKYVRFSLFKELESKGCDILVEDTFKEHLVFPHKEFLSNTEDIKKLCKSPESNVKAIEEPQQKYDFLMWLLNNADPLSGNELDTFCLNNQGAILKYAKQNKLPCILSHRNLQKLETLKLKCCRLNEFVSLENFPDLKELNIAENNIKSIHISEQHTELETLKLFGNPIEKLDTQIPKLPNLKRLVMGSKVTRYLSKELLQRTLGDVEVTGYTSESRIRLSKLSIEVPESEENKFRKALQLPAYKALTDESLISKFIDNPETYLPKLTNLKDRLEALDWLVENYKATSTTFDLSHQDSLCEKLGMSKLSETIQNMPSLRKLTLQNCKLKAIPNISQLNHLEALDMSFNRLEDISDSIGHESLTTLKVQGNPLRNVELEMFPNLTTLICGSSETKSISRSLLKRYASGELKELHVPSPEMGKSLVMPPYPVLYAGRESVQAYIDNEEICLSSISSPKEDLAPYLAMINNAEKVIKSLRLSNITCLSALLKEPAFTKLLSHDKLQTVQSLYIDNCCLKEYPSEIHLPNLSRLDISRNKCESLHDIPTTVTSLMARNCGFYCIPAIGHLEKLDIQENNVTSMQTDTKFRKLKELNVVGNSIKEIKICKSAFPVLHHIQAGSPNTHYVHCDLIEEHTKYQKIIDIPEEQRNYLYMPPKECFTNLSEYIKDPELYAGSLDSINWLLETGKSDFRSFSLSKRTTALNQLSESELRDILGHRSLTHVQRLSVNGYGLKNIPQVSHLEALEYLNMCDNDITDIPADILLHKCLTNLYIDGNPIPEINITSKNFPSLTELRCGSRQTETISRNTLRRCILIENRLSINIPPEYLDYLKFPSVDVILGGAESIREHLEDTGLDLSYQQVGGITMEAIKRNIESFHGCIKSLNVSGQNCIALAYSGPQKILSSSKVEHLENLEMQTCYLTNIPGVKHLHHLKGLNLSGNNGLSNAMLYNSLSIQTLTVLSLNDTSLNSFPSLMCLPKLTKLEFSNNKMIFIRSPFGETLGKPHPLEELSIDGNPIEEIYINCESFSNLRKLTCGSTSTKYICWQLLQKATHDLTIEIPENYKKFLLICPAKYLEEDRKTLSNYLSDTRVDMSQIRNAWNRYNALNWLFDQKEKVVKSLVISGQKDFCAHQRFSLQTFLNHSKLSILEELHLDGCGLDTIPIMRYSLPQLKLLDVSNNNLTEITSAGSTFTSHPLLERLMIDRNPIQTIHIDKVSDNFPSLNVIQAGSKETNYFSNTILEAASRVDNPIKVDILDEYGDYLINPPYEILKGGPHNLRIFMQARSSKYKKGENTDVIISTTQNILMFLGTPEAGKTSLQRTLKTGESVLAADDDRTVILNRDYITIGKFDIVTYDFGGHDIYEMEYPLFMRGQNIIVLIVIDLNLYEEDKHDEMVTKWLHNCILCEKCTVLFVGTKRDEVSKGIVKAKIKTIKSKVLKWAKDELDFLEQAREQLDKNEARHCEESSIHYRRVKKSIEFFKAFRDDIEVIDISSQTQHNLDKVKKKIRNSIVPNKASLPGAYSKIFDYIKGRREHCKYLISFNEVQEWFEMCVKDDENYYKEEKGFTTKFSAWVKSKVGYGHDPVKEEKATPKEIIMSCLDYFHKKGEILWYKDLEDHIFVNIDNILELHKKLYRHDLKETMQYSFVNHRYKIANETAFDLQKRDFLVSGFATMELLDCLWHEDDLSKDDLKSMVDLLRMNNHCFIENTDATDDCYGDQYRPSSDGAQLRFPWFIEQTQLPKSFWKREWPSHIPDDHIEFQLCYTFFRRLPSTLFERLSVRLQRILPQKSHRTDWADGVYAKIGKVQILIERNKNLENPELTIKLRAYCTDILNLWCVTRDIYMKVLYELIEESPAVVTYNNYFICPHCILKRHTDNSTDNNTSKPVKHPLTELMNSKCGRDSVVHCSNADTEGQETALVAAAFLSPLHEDCPNLAEHLKRVEEDVCRLRNTAASTEFPSNDVMQLVGTGYDMADTTELGIGIPDDQLMEIAANVPLPGMKQLGMKYLGIRNYEIDNWVSACREEVEMINFKILEKWRNVNLEEDAASKLHELLMKGVRDGLITRDAFTCLLPGPVRPCHDASNNDLEQTQRKLSYLESQV